MTTPQGGFLGLPEELRDPARARVHVLPIPYEATVSYEPGTADGPAAIIGASQQVEMYDQELDAEPCLEWGIHTLPAVVPTPQTMVVEVAAAAQAVVSSGRLLLTLGGEHGISPGLVRGVRRSLASPLTVVQIDAHADLRDTYQEDRYSHACAMRRILEENEGPLVQIGIRSWSREEEAFARASRGRLEQWPAERVHGMPSQAFLGQLRQSVRGKRVYLTIDVDGLDPSMVPATGTPEPGGLSWSQALDVVRLVCTSSEVVALDCVELAPKPGLHASQFTVAKLLYKTLSYIMRARGPGEPPERARFRDRRP